jgi:hypothetical protein
MLNRDDPHWFSEILDRLIPLAQDFGSREESAANVLGRNYKRVLLEDMDGFIEVGEQGVNDPIVMQFLNDAETLVADIKERVYRAQKAWYDEWVAAGCARPTSPEADDSHYDSAWYENAVKVYDHFATEEVATVST